MTASPGPCYRFATPAQIALLLNASLAETLIVDPSHAADAGSIAGCGASAIELDNNGSLFWVDKQGRLFGQGCDAFPSDITSSGSEAVRLVAGSHHLWVLCRVPDGKLVQFDLETLHRLIHLEADGVIDVAPDGRDGLWLLERKSICHVDSRGRRKQGWIELDDSAAHIAASGGVIAAVSDDGMRLLIHDSKTGRAVSLQLDEVLGAGAKWADFSLSAGAGAFLLAGTIEAASGSAPRFMLIDTNGDFIVHGRWRDDLGPELVTMAGGDLLALFAAGPGSWKLRRFVDVIRRGGQRILTPALDTETPEGRWLRADLVATLPEGTTVELRWAVTADQGLRRTVETIFADVSLTRSARLARIDEILPWEKAFTYVGKPFDAGEWDPVAEESFALPLHEAEGSTLWLDAQLRRHGGPYGATFKRLTIFHEADSLMDNLPAIYSHKGDGDRSLRRLVGVLEATTQDIDQRIESLAERLDPSRTARAWLPDLATMLGLPFHDGLSPPMQRALLGVAPTILARRGTRGGLLAMLQALLPGRPIQVTDRTEQFIPIALGNGRGLPALLAGPSMRQPKLNARLVLSRTALCRADACIDGLIAPSPEVLVVISATRGEQRRYGHALRSMIEEILPAGVSLRLRWTSWAGAATGLPETVLTIVDSPVAVSLGTGPALGCGTAGGRRPARLDRSGVVPSEHRLT